MKTSRTWNFRSIMGRIMMGLVLAAMIGSIDVAPVLAKNDKHDKGRYEHRGRGYDRDHRGRGYGHDRGRHYGHHYGHRERGYYPSPPVVFAPPPPPGISIFFPPLFIHP